MSIEKQSTESFNISKIWIQIFLWYIQASPLLPGLLSLQDRPQCPVSNHHQWLQMKHDNLKQFIVLGATHPESHYIYWQCLWRQHITSNHHCSSVAFRGHIKWVFFSILMFQCYFLSTGKNASSNPPSFLLDPHARPLQLSPFHPRNKSVSDFEHQMRTAVHFRNAGSMGTLTPWNPGIPSYPISPLAPLEEVVMLVRDRWHKTLSNLCEG